jgi:hypothetical protein
MSKNMRSDMPKTAAFIDSIRKAFGEDHVNSLLRRVMRGEQVFHATENGFEIGTPLLEPNVVVSWDEKGVSQVTNMKEGK